MAITEGALVRHTVRPEFGLGRVIEVGAKNVHIFFPAHAAREAVMFQRSAPLVEVTDDVSDIAVWLTNLPPLTKSGNRWVLPEGVQTHEQAVQMFLRLFPGGFTDPKYLEEERGYKVAAHERWVETLGRGQAEALVQKGDWGELKTRMRRVESRLNLLFSIEKAALNDALREPEKARDFLASVVRFAQGPEAGTQSSFEALVDATAALPSEGSRVLTWPIVTLFPFCADPNQHVFVKPEVTRAAGTRMAFELHYQSKPNWKTYNAVRELARMLNRRLQSSGAADFIDAQTFIWSVCNYDDPMLTVPQQT